MTKKTSFETNYKQKKCFLRVPDSVIHNKKSKKSKRTSFCTQNLLVALKKSSKKFLLNDVKNYGWKKMWE